VAVTVIVPVRDVVPALAVALIVNEPLLVPLAGAIVSQATLLDTLQALLDVTDTVKLLAVWGGLQDVCDRLKVAAAGAPAWVTVTVRVGAPVAVTVIVPVRDAVPVLAAALIVNEPLLVPLAGAIVSQVTLRDTLQALLDVTDTVKLFAVWVGLQVA